MRIQRVKDCCNRNRFNEVQLSLTVRLAAMWINSRFTYKAKLALSLVAQGRELGALPLPLRHHNLYKGVDHPPLLTKGMKTTPLEPYYIQPVGTLTTKT
jgi:hypothetical protein